MTFSWKKVAKRGSWSGLCLKEQLRKLPYGHFSASSLEKERRIRDYLKEPDSYLGFIDPIDSGYRW